MGMIVFGISMLTNTGLNYILIFGKFGAPALRITGAAIATLPGAGVRDRRGLCPPLPPSAPDAPPAAAAGGGHGAELPEIRHPVLVNEVLWVWASAL